MRPTQNMARRIKSVNITVDAETNEKVFGNILKAFKESKAKQSAVSRLNMWRIIMYGAENRKVKVAIVVIMFIVLLGLVPFNGTTAWARAANGATAALARLKAMVLGKELHGTEHVERQVDKTAKILTKSVVYSSPDISSLEDFLSKRNIFFVRAGSGNAKYAVISSDVVIALEEFLQSSDGYDIVASPTVLTYAGGEAMIAIVNTAGAAISALQDESGHLRLDFAFHNGQNGCEISQIELARGEALLISGIRTGQNESSDRLMTVLVLPEIIQD